MPRSGMVTVAIWPSCVICTVELYLRQISTKEQGQVGCTASEQVARLARPAPSCWAVSVPQAASPTPLQSQRPKTWEDKWLEPDVLSHM